MDAFDGVPVWHVSLSFQRAQAVVAVNAWPREVRAEVEREARRLLRGVGAGPRRWEHGEAAHVLHVRQRLSDAEVAALPRGPEPVDMAGGGPLYRPLTVRP